MTTISTFMIKARNAASQPFRISHFGFKALQNQEATE